MSVHLRARCLQSLRRLLLLMCRPPPAQDERLVLKGKSPGCRMLLRFKFFA